MNPVDFIRKNIAAQLASEGFPDQVCQGGGWSALTTTAECRRQAAKVGLMTIAFSAPVSGLSDKQQAQNARQRKSRIREESPHPACSDFACSYLQRNQLLQEPFHEKYLSGDINREKQYQ